MDRIEKALELRSKMYNCCQAVVCTFADVAGVEEQVLFKIRLCSGLVLPA